MPLNWTAKRVSTMQPLKFERQQHMSSGDRLAPLRISPVALPPPLAKTQLWFVTLGVWTGVGAAAPVVPPHAASQAANTMTDETARNRVMARSLSPNSNDHTTRASPTRTTAVVLLQREPRI